MKAQTLSVHYNYFRSKNKHLVWFYDGIRTHSDGSLASDMRTFANKPDLNEFINSLTKQGYTFN